MDEKWLEYNLNYAAFSNDWATLAADKLNALKQQYYIQEVIVFNVKPGVVHLLVLVSEKGREGVFSFEETESILPNLTHIWNG